MKSFCFGTKARTKAKLKRKLCQTDHPPSPCLQRGENRRRGGGGERRNIAIRRNALAREMVSWSACGCRSPAFLPRSAGVHIAGASTASADGHSTTAASPVRSIGAGSHGERTAVGGRRWAGDIGVERSNGALDAAIHADSSADASVEKYSPSPASPPPTTEGRASSANRSDASGSHASSVNPSISQQVAVTVS